MPQIGGLLRIGNFLQDFGDAAADIFAKKAELVLVARSVALVLGRLAAHADESTVAGPGMNENMGVEIVGIVVNAVGVAHRISPMKFVLKRAHAALDDAAQGHVGIAAGGGKRVVKFTGDGKNEAVMRDLGFTILLGMGSPNAAKPPNHFLG
jgi:hypothetical protein